MVDIAEAFLCMYILPFGNKPQRLMVEVISSLEVPSIKSFWQNIFKFNLDIPKVSHLSCKGFVCVYVCV